MSNIRRSAKGEDCQIRICGHCNFDPETTVLCHLNGGGAGMKHNDIHAAYGCSSCHDVVDGRVRTEFSKEDIQLMFYDGMVRTQKILIDKGLIKT